MHFPCIFKYKQGDTNPSYSSLYNNHCVVDPQELYFVGVLHLKARLTREKFKAMQVCKKWTEATP